ncbi:hypothetical protein RvY_09130 [Ramazzottius varieornatus]|uniref:RNA polymerase II-associated factor 1 homolog n=1 Tax=Ramazzottius varieornatus TaxID=947166 RepID=A0A1D1VDU2_RAMVA|nr:hypothetical protein RvY_09130 [Ramazzottius varieornatus]
MAPPPMSTSGSRRPYASSSLEKDDFLCRTKYLNRLPDLPADTKFLVYNVDMAPYVKYSSTSLEKEYKRDINCDSDMGMKLSLLTMPSFKLPTGPDSGADIDALLCEDEVLNETQTSSKPQRIDHGRQVAWLRKTQYINNDYGLNRQEVSSEKAIKRPVITQMHDLDLRTRVKRAEAIQDTFDFAINKPKKHPNKPDLKAVEETAIFPDFDLAKYPVVCVTFETDPAPPAVHGYIPDEVMANTMLRGMTDEHGNQTVAYFVPPEETMRKLEETRGMTDDNEEYVFKLHREFSLPEDKKPQVLKDKEDNAFAFNIRDGSMFFLELETKVKLVRRARGAKKNKSKLVVRFTSAANSENKAPDAPPDNEIEEPDQPEQSPSTRIKLPVDSPSNGTNGNAEGSDEEDNTPPIKQEAERPNDHNESSDESEQSDNEVAAARKAANLSESDSDSD